MITTIVELNTINIILNKPNTNIIYHLTTGDNFYFERTIYLMSQQVLTQIVCLSPKELTSDH